MPELSKVAGVAAAVGSGAGLAIQSAMNAALAVPLGSGLLASLVSFVVGVGSLSLLLPFKLGQKPRDQGPNPKPLHWWHILGGFIGVVYICAGTFLGPRLGYGLFFCAVVAGQVITGLVLDHVAFIDLRRQPVTVWRLGSMLVVLVGAVLAIVDKVDVSGAEVGRIVGFVIVAFVSGCLMAIQAPINSSLTIRSGTLPHRTAWFSFFVGTILILIIWGISVGVIGNGLADAHASETDPYMWFGGMIGAVYVVASVALAPVLGIALFIVFVVFGQLFMSLFIDSFGLFASAEVPVSAMRIVGVVLVFVGAAAFRLLPVRRETLQKLNPLHRRPAPAEQEREEKHNEWRSEVEDPSTASGDASLTVSRV